MPVTNIHEAKTQLSQLIHRALAGEDVVIARAGEPLVRLVPVHRDTRPRQGGQMKGQVRMASDFDAYDAQVEKLIAGDGSL
jgi:prevent-host-death family protein